MFGITSRAIALRAWVHRAIDSIICSAATRCALFNGSCGFLCVLKHFLSFHSITLCVLPHVRDTVARPFFVRLVVRFNTTALLRAVTARPVNITVFAVGSSQILSLIRRR